MGRVAATIKKFLERPDAERRLGPFLLVKPLGSGGFAPVWLAREVYESIEVRTAAVKLFALQRRPQNGGSSRVADKVRAGIIAETSALCKVEHPNVVRFYSHAIDEDSGVMGLAMEHIAGTALDRHLETKGRLSVREALAVGTAIASALAAVHRAGLVHRDVKPSNVIEAGGVYKLIDFGIAAADILGAPDALASAPEIVDDLPLMISPSRPPGLLGEATMRLGFQAGTRGYMDPVCVATREPATAASDLYALGAMLFECLTGQVPAAAGTRRGTGLDEDVLDGFAKAPALEAIAVEVPSLLGDVIDTLLAPERADRPPSAEWVAARFEQIRSELNRPSRALPTEDRGPFRGLGRFEESDRDVYFGRKSEIAHALDKLRSHGLVTISGSSGSGKSSLARAGVLPTLADGGLGPWPERWDTAVAEPGRDPRAAIALALDPFVSGAAAMTAEALVVALAERARKEDRGVILLVDQLEELATMASGESQSWTADLLIALAQKAPAGVRVLAAARRDLLDPLLAMGGLGEAMAPGLVLIKPITDQVWGDVLDQALLAYGYTFEDDALRSDLLAELEGTAGAMPLVQFALTELWHKRDAGAKKVTRQGLEAIGGIAGALERHAEATLEALGRTHADAEAAARTVLIGLTTPQGTRSTRKLADLQREAGPAAEGVITALEEARLIVRSAHGVTLAHEALLTQWGRLRAWAAEARQDRLLAEELERDAERWCGDPEGVPLWPRRRLALGEELRERGGQRLSASAARFLKASRWASLRIWLLAGGSALMVALSLLGFGSAYVRAERRSRMNAEAQTRALQVKQREIDALMLQLEQTNNPAQRQEITRQILDVGGNAKPLASTPLPPAPPARALPVPVAHPPLASAATPVTPPPTPAVTITPLPASAPPPTDFPSVSSFPEAPSPP